MNDIMKDTTDMKDRQFFNPLPKAKNPCMDDVCLLFSPIEGVSACARKMSCTPHPSQPAYLVESEYGLQNNEKIEKMIDELSSVRGSGFGYVHKSTIGHRSA